MSDPITSPTPPDLRTVLDGLKREIFDGLNCHEVGIIENFDKDKQTATVRIAVLKVFPEKTVPYPLLTDCPVYFPAGGSAYMTFPVKKGDTCLVLFNDRDLDNWFATGNVVAPNSPRLHSLSDGLVLVGFRNLATPPPATLDDAVTIWNNGSRISVKDDGSVEIVLDGATKVKVENGSVNLKTALDALCTALTTWVNTGGSTPNPATVTAINAVKTQFDTLLQ